MQYGNNMTAKKKTWSRKKQGASVAFLVYVNPDVYKKLNESWRKLGYVSRAELCRTLLNKFAEAPYQENTEDAATAS